MRVSTTFRRLVFVAAAFSAGGVVAAGCGLDDTAIERASVGGTEGDASLVDAGVVDSSSSDGGGTTDSGPGACAATPCENGGICADTADGGFACTCANGFAGATCATNIDDCHGADGGNVCLNGGTCTDGVASFSCSCAAGFTGTNCQTNVDDCASNPCAHGTCNDGINTYTCSCNTGFAGANCDTCATNYFSYPTCTFCTANDTCSNHGTCSATGTCNCTTGFMGASCNACATSYYNYPTCTFCDPTVTCSGHGTCTATGTCSCSTNYSGANCGTFSGSYSGSATMPSTNGNSDTDPQYGQVNGTAAFSTTSTDNTLTIATATTLTKLTFGPETGDIGNRTWTATVMKNNATTAMTCSIAANGTTCNVTTNVALAVNDKINIRVVQSQNTGFSRTATWTINYTQP